MRTTIARPGTASALGAGRPPSRDIGAARLRAGLRQRLLGTAPFRLGRYELGQVLGRGGFGAVHRAYDPELQRDVAVKVVRLPVDRDLEDAAEEARAMARIEHPNIVDVYDVGVVGDELYVVMELVTGGTLRTWLQTPRPIDEVRDVLLASGRGLAASHAAGIVHHDFKPDNVLMTEQGTPRVTDFGLAAGLGSRSADTLHSEDEDDAAPRTARGGTLGYAAPERLLGRPGDPRSDQFAWCVTAFEALVGQPPFTGATSEQMAASITRGVDPRDPAAWRALPRHTRRALLRGLAASPADRFASMNDLLEALAERRRRSTWVLLAASATLVGGLAINALRTSDADSTTPSAVTETPASPAETAQLEGARRRAESALALALQDDLEQARAAADEAEQAVGDLRAPQIRATIALVRGVDAQERNADDTAIEALELAVELGMQADANSIVARASSQLAFIYSSRKADLEQADTWARAGLAAVERGDDPSLAAPLLSTMAQMEHNRGNLDESIELYRRGLEQYEQSGEARAIITSWVGLAEAYVERGDLDEATAAVAHSKDTLDRELPQGGILKADVLSISARVALVRGEVEVALGEWIEAARIAEALGRIGLGSVASSNVNAGHALMELGRAAEAETRYRNAEEKLAELGDETPDMLAPMYSGLARSLYAQSKDADAAQAVERGLLALVGRLDEEHILWADLSLLRGQLRLDAGELDSATESYDRARRCFVVANLDWGIALADFGLAQVALARGDRKLALGLAQQAVDELPPQRAGIARVIEGWVEEARR